MVEVVGLTPVGGSLITCNFNMFHTAHTYTHTIHTASHTYSAQMTYFCHSQDNICALRAFHGNFQHFGCCTDPSSRSIVPTPPPLLMPSFLLLHVR